MVKENRKLTLREYLKKHGYEDQNLTENELNLRIYRPEIVNQHGEKILKFDVGVSLNG